MGAHGKLVLGLCAVIFHLLHDCGTFLTIGCPNHSRQRIAHAKYRLIFFPSHRTICEQFS